jgi:hypothetical protein
MIKFIPYKTGFTPNRNEVLTDMDIVSRDTEGIKKIVEQAREIIKTCGRLQTSWGIYQEGGREE